MTQHLNTRHRRLVAKSLVGLAIGATVLAAMAAPGTANAGPFDSSSPSYQLGYSNAVKDLGLTATRMRAEGFSQQDILVSNRVPTICAKESASAQNVPDLNTSDFMRGCADGMKSLLDAGIAS